MSAVQIVLLFKFDVKSAVQTVVLFSHLLSRLLSSVQRVLFQPNSHGNAFKLVDGSIVNVERESILLLCEPFHFMKA